MGFYPSPIYPQRGSFAPLRVCCTNLGKDSSRDSSVIAGVDEQIQHTDLQDHELPADNEAFKRRGR